MILYFGYGSNMCTGRLRSRVPSACPLSVARLKGHSLRFHKQSKDGSGKADAYRTGDNRNYVWGIVFEVDPAEKGKLDEVEGLRQGYEEKTVTVSVPMMQDRKAFMYYATAIDAHLKPYTWYLRFVLDGARQHRLPSGYIAKIKAVSSIRDLDRNREAKEMAVRC
jgi:gamma-glutamylcyclotransferase